MSKYVRIPPKTRRKGDPAPTKRFRIGSHNFEMDLEPKTNPLWYRVDDELAKKLARHRAFEGAPPTFEVLSEEQFEERVEEHTARTFNVRDGHGVIDARAALEREDGEPVDEDEEKPGRADVGLTAPKKKAPKKKAPKKKAAPKAAPKAD